MSRGIYIVGNWKMYKTAREATDYISELAPSVKNSSLHVYLAVPFTSIHPASRLAKGTKIVIGAQNMSDAREGAFTGEIAALMLKEAGASFVILGHSERRRAFGETDGFIHKKIIRALSEDLRPILCIGEDLEERESGKTEEVLKSQIAHALEGIPVEEAKKVLIAYEPVWAIGTNKSASASVAESAHDFCRSCLAELLGLDAAEEISILYGGSVKAENASSFVSQKNIDGVLIGGASLDPKMFSEIVLSCEKVK